MKVKTNFMLATIAGLLLTITIACEGSTPSTSLPVTAPIPSVAAIQTMPTAADIQISYEAVLATAENFDDLIKNLRL